MYNLHLALMLLATVNVNQYSKQVPPYLTVLQHSIPPPVSWGI